MTKTVSLSDEAYERLKEWKKGETESFSETVIRLFPRRLTREEIRDIMHMNTKADDETGYAEQ